MEAIGYRRVSGERQRGNSSFARQEEDEVTPFCEDEGWTLTRWVSDDGVSASTGENITTGSLAAFIRECEIEGGDGKVLIVGEQDRLSRIHEIDFFEWFLKVLRTGLTVAFADNRMVVDLNSFRNQKRQMRRILDDAEEATRYTERLGRRVRAAWQQMRDEGRPVHCRSTCPAWLELTPDRLRFRDDTTQALYRIALINEIFDLYIEGMGKSAVAKLLNERGEPTWRGGDGWQKTAISRIIHNRAMIGEYQHHVRRKPVGDPVPGYFPQVVSNEKWLAANESAHRRIMASHSHERKLTNLLSDVAKCSECGGRMLFRNKARKANGEPVAYLQCDRAARNHGCTAKRMVRYYPLERQVLDALLTRALDDQHFQKNDEVASTKRKMADQRRVIDDIQVRINNLIESIERFSDKPSLMAQLEVRLRTADLDLDTANNAMASLEEQLSGARGKASRAEHVTRIGEIRTDLRSKDRTKADAAALLVKSALNDLIMSLRICVSQRRATADLTGPIGFVTFFEDEHEPVFVELLKRWVDYSYLSNHERKVIEGYIRRTA